jgi:Cof subfamily protein (haloacid dehalogenase superfamily)
LKYRLIVSDLDGTLLDSKRNISDRTKELINRYINKGGTFTFATGRMEGSARDYIEFLSIESPAIIYNGAKVVDIKKEKVSYEANLDYNTARTALKLSKEYNWDVILYINKKVFVNSITEGIKEYMVKDGVKCEPVGDLFEFLNSSPTKILIIGNPEKFEEYILRLNKTLNILVNNVRSEWNYLEILPDGISKGEALKRLAAELRIPLEEVIAIGDELNDLSMIKVAGLGVAVANANPELIKIADYITKSHDEDGVAEVIDKVLNGEL